MERDYTLLERMARLPDDILIGPEEVAAIAGFAVSSIRQHRVEGIPEPKGGMHKLRWRLGDIRDWVNPARQSPRNGKKRHVHLAAGVQP